MQRTKVIDLKNLSSKKLCRFLHIKEIVGGAGLVAPAPAASDPVLNIVSIVTLLTEGGQIGRVVIGGVMVKVRDG